MTTMNNYDQSSSHLDDPYDPLTGAAVGVPPSSSTGGASDEGPMFISQQQQQQLQQEQQPIDDIDFDDPNISSLPRVLLMGPRRGGKTSIQVRECVAEEEGKCDTVAYICPCLTQPPSHFSSLQRVVFQKMSPHETLFRLEATQGLERALVDHTPLCRFSLWDFPGDYYADSTEDQEAESSSVFAGSTSLIFVVDAQDEPYDHVLQSFTNAVTRALQVNPNIAVEVFINKVDGELFLSDESKVSLPPSFSYYFARLPYLVTK